MSNFAKKVLSAVSSVAIIAAAIVPAGVSAALTSLEAANALAGAGVIVDQSANTSAYRLGDTITREELSKVIAKLGNLTVSGDDSIYQDTDFASWSEKYAKALNEAGFAASNAFFNPKDNTSKVEALKFVMEARDIASGEGSVWQEARVNGAVAAGIATSFSDYDTDVTRGQVFIWAAEALALEDDDDFLSDLLGGLDDDEDDVDTGDSGSSGIVNTSADEVVVSLSPETPVAGTVPGGANGVPVAAFDVTAGSADVVLDGFVLKRKGLSDEDTLEALAVFTENGRASKSRDDSQENDDQANLNFNEDEVIQAGTTRTFTVVADVARTVASNDEFSIELLQVETDASVTFEGRVVGETFRVAGVDAPEIVFQDDGTVSNPTLGETDAEIFKFEIEGADDEDVILRSLTFRSSETDVEDNLRNFKLTQNNDVLATTEATIEEFLTFDLGEGYVIEEDTDLSFVVTADIVEGATDTFAFFIDQNLDVTALSTKFDTVASANIEDVDAEGDLGTVIIDAGELVLQRINPEVDEIKEDKDDVVLGEFTITNDSGGDLDLEEFGVVVELSGSATFSAGANAATNVNVDSIFDDFEILNKNTGRTDTLELEGPVGGNDNITRGVYADDSLGIQIPEGVTTFVLRADTADEILDFGNVEIDLSFATINNDGTIDAENGFFVVEEQDDDEEVTDISPSFISFDNLEGIESTAELSANPLATTTAVRGGEGVAVLEFEIEADEASTLEVDEITISGEFIQLGSGAQLVDVFTGAITPEPITNDEISNITIYLDSIAPENILESEGGTEIENGGQITFNDFDNIFIQPNQTQTFVVTIDIIDGDTVENIAFRNFTVVDVDIDDEDNDDVDASPLQVSSDNAILVTPAGILTANFDDSNEANEDPKTILAGSDDQVVFSIDVQSTNEPTDVEDVIFTLSGSNLSQIRNAISNASLYLNGVFIDRNTNSDIDLLSGSTTQATVLFDDLDDLIIPEQTSELELRLNTASIGFQRVGVSLVDVSVVNVAFEEIEGDESDEDVDDITVAGTSQDFTIARAVLVPRVSQGANSSNPTVGINADLGDNRADNDNTIPNVLLEELRFDVTGTTANTTISLQNADGTTTVTQVVGTGSVLTFDISSFTADEQTISSGNEEFFELQITPDPAAENVTVSIELLRDGLTYTVEGDTFTTNASEDLEVSTYQE